MWLLLRGHKKASTRSGFFMALNSRLVMLSAFRSARVGY